MVQEDEKTKWTTDETPVLRQNILTSTSLSLPFSFTHSPTLSLSISLSLSSYKMMCLISLRPPLYGGPIPTYLMGNTGRYCLTRKGKKSLRSARKSQEWTSGRSETERGEKEGERGERESRSQSQSSQRKEKK